MGKELQKAGPILAEVPATAGDSRILRWLRRQTCERPEGPCLWISVHRSNAKHAILDEIAQFRVPGKLEDKRLAELADDIGLAAGDDACGPAAATEYVARDWHGKVPEEAKTCSTCFFVPTDAPSAETQDGEATAVALDLMIKHCEIQQRNNTQMMGIVLAHQTAALQLAETRARAAEEKSERQQTMIEEAAQRQHERQIEEAHVMSELNRKDKQAALLEEGIRWLGPHVPSWIGLVKDEPAKTGVDPHKATFAKVVEAMPEADRDALKALIMKNAPQAALPAIAAAFANFREHLAVSKQPPAPPEAEKK